MARAGAHKTRRAITATSVRLTPPATPDVRRCAVYAMLAHGLCHASAITTPPDVIATIS